MRLTTKRVGLLVFELRTSKNMFQRSFFGRLVKFVQCSAHDLF